MIEDDIKQMQQDISNLNTRTIDIINRMNKLEQDAISKANNLKQLYSEINKLFRENDKLELTQQSLSKDIEEAQEDAHSAYSRANEAYDRAREVHNLIQPKEHGQRYRNRLDEIDLHLDKQDKEISGLRLEHRPGLKAV